MKKALIFVLSLAMPFAASAVNFAVQTASGFEVLSGSPIDGTYVAELGNFAGGPVVTGDGAAIDAAFDELATSAGGDIVAGLVNFGGTIPDGDVGVTGAFTPGEDAFLFIHSADFSEFALIQFTSPFLGNAFPSNFSIDPNVATALAGSFAGNNLTLIPEPTSALFVALTGLVALRRRRK